jgi:hypothetical protein
MWIKLNKVLLIQLIYLSLSGITAIQKIIPFQVPDWFINKFQNTIIGHIHFGIGFSFVLITIIECIISVLLILSIIKQEYKENIFTSYLNMALDLCLVLFLILFFGSFLANDYQNGALDFFYFLGTYFTYQQVNFKEKNS